MGLEFQPTRPLNVSGLCGRGRHYFGVEVLKQYFPDAKLVSTAPTRQKIEATLATQLQVWGPRMGANAPRAVPLPDVLSGNTIRLEDQMKKAYPDAGLTIALAIGAKVHKGEMTW